MDGTFAVMDEELKNGEVRTWHEVSEELADQMLGAVPPMRGGFNAYVCGEAQTHTLEGRGVYFTCINRGGKYYATYATVTEWDDRALVVGRPLPKLNLFRYWEL